MNVLQYDSYGSDSQESTEEAELRRKKIEAVKVSLAQVFFSPLGSLSLAVSITSA